MSVLPVTQNIIVNDSVTETLQVGGGSGPVAAPENYSVGFVTGTSTAGTVANVIDLHWEKSAVTGTAVTLASAASVTYTLSALTDSLSRSIAFARLRRISIKITAKTAGDYLTVGNAAVHPCSDIVSGTGVIKVTDYYLVVAADIEGLVVTSGSSDQLKITNSGANPITFEICLSGCST